MFSHVTARPVIVAAWKRLFGRAPTLAEVQAAQSIVAAESQYGAGWKNECAGSNNWGAVQSGKTPCGPGECEYTDTHPNADGTSTPYQICFRAYATPEDGAFHALQMIFTRAGAKREKVLQAAQTGSLQAFSAAMYRSGYYEGFGATPEQRMANHYKYIRRWAEKIATANNEKLVDDMPRRKRGSGAGGLAVAALLIGGGIAAARKWGR